MQQQVLTLATGLAPPCTNSLRVPPAAHELHIPAAPREKKRTVWSVIFKNASLTSSFDTSSFGVTTTFGGASIASASVDHWRPLRPVTFITTRGTTTGMATSVAMAWTIRKVGPGYG